MKGTKERESLCAIRFRDQGPYWHIWTRDNHSIIFASRQDFMAAMNIMAIVARLCPSIRIITFEWMSNHVHIVVAGSEEEIHHFTSLLGRLIDKHYKGISRCMTNGFSHVIKPNLEFSVREIASLAEARNVIAYDNRNGFLVSPDESPYSYPWGANRYYFNPDAKSVYGLSEKYLTILENRGMIFSHMADKIKPIKMVYGYACPMDFCHIDEGEGLFASASQYFHAVSRCVESYKSIAEELVESIFLTDEEMFSVVCSIALNKFQTKLSDLNNNDRLELANQMHFHYNSSNKQISRILKLPQQMIDTMFPKSPNI